MDCCLLWDLLHTFAENHLGGQSCSRLELLPQAAPVPEPCSTKGQGLGTQGGRGGAPASS